MKFISQCFLIVILFQGSCSYVDKNPVSWSDCGGNVGDHACDFSLMDQTGNKWTLYSHYGSIIVLDFSAMWCGYCQKAAAVAQKIQDKHKNDNVIWVTILLQNNYGQQPSLEDLNVWAAEFDMSSSPVVSGNSTMIDNTAKSGYNISSWPGLVVIDSDMSIAYELKGWNEMQVKLWLENLINKALVDSTGK